MDTALLVAVLLVSYALGTFPTAVLVGRRLGFDPTTAGSGNPGASNTTRLGGFRAGAMVLVGDLGKGAAAAGLGYAVGDRTTAWLAGSAAVIGHLWPLTRRLRGGKGVATVAGVGLVCAPAGFLALGVVFAVLAKVSGHAAVGSIAVAALIPVAQLLLGQELVELGVGAALGAIVIARHRSNIRQLLTGAGARVGPRAE